MCNKCKAFMCSCKCDPEHLSMAGTKKTGIIPFMHGTKAVGACMKCKHTVNF